MYSNSLKLIGGVILLSFTILPFSCIKSLTQTTLVYANDFERGDPNGIAISGWNNGSFGNITGSKIENYNGSNVLGKFNNNLIILDLTNLPQHQILRVEMDLYLHNKWQNDLWKMSLDGADQLLTGFSNNPAIQQAYPNWLGNGSPLSPAGADAQNTNLPGVCTLSNQAGGTSMYHIISTIPHSGTGFVLTCSDAGGQVNDTCQRSWSIDNLKVTIFKN